MIFTNKLMLLIGEHQIEQEMQNTQQLSLLLKDVAGEFVLSVSAFESKVEYQLENVFGAAKSIGQLER